jgi:hypothetical protein
MRFVCAAFAALMAALPAAANEITSQEPIDALRALDLNGDGKKELIWQAGRRLNIYFYKEPRGYSLAPDRQAQFELPADVALYAFGDVDGAPGPEIVGLAGNGVRAWRLDGNRVAAVPIELLGLTTAFESTALEKPRPREFLRDFDGDGDLDLLVPRKGFLAFYVQAKPREFELAQKLPVDMETTVHMGGGSFLNSIVRAVSFPRHWLQDFDADGKADFIFFRGSSMRVHRRVEGGLFSTEASRVFSFDQFVKRKRRRREVFNAFSEVSPEVTDVNRDGKADVLIMLPGKGKVGVFRGGGEKPFNEGQVVALSGWTFRRDGIPMLTDLNSDGRPDLVLLNIPELGVWDILEVFFSRKIEVKTFFYIARADGSYPAADHEMTTTVPLILSVTKEVRLETPFLMTVDGDVNGDGLRDMIIKDQPDRLEIRYGTSDGVFHKSTDREIPIRDTGGLASEPALVTDLNGDGLDDVILHHSDIERGTSVLEVIRMRK